MNNFVLRMQIGFGFPRLLRSGFIYLDGHRVYPSYFSQLNFLLLVIVAIHFLLDAAASKIHSRDIVVFIFIYIYMY